ncbi:MAG: potassium channel family protein [Ilumatobacter sp.]
MFGILALFRALFLAIRGLTSEPEGRGLITLVVGLIAVGGIFYHRVENLSWLDSFYFTIVTLTTVGYGDISPTTAAGKVFTSLYLLIGIGLLVAFATKITSRMVDARKEIVEDRQRRRS